MKVINEFKCVDCKKINYNKIREDIKNENEKTIQTIIDMYNNEKTKLVAKINNLVIEESQAFTLPCRRLV